MKKQVFTIGYEIPGHSDNLSFHSDHSLMDADILLISPEAILPIHDWVSFTTGGGGCYEVSVSQNYKQKVSQLKKEIQDHLNSGKNVFILLTAENRLQLADSVHSPKKGQHTYNTEIYSNYSFLPISIGTLTSATGKHLEFSGNSIFSDFYKKFKDNLKYQLYLENVNDAQILFTGKDKTKILGAIFKGNNGGQLVALPFIDYDEDKFTTIDKVTKEECWNNEALKFGQNLINCLLQIDQQLTQKSEKTPIPDWALKKDFFSTKEVEIQKEIKENQQKIKDKESNITKLNKALIEENTLKDLLFEQGKPLEYAVIKALKILGYKAENYDDGILELDQVIISPEDHRYIGECEGKDNKDIDITKFRQLLESLNADFAREEVSEKALGILFGNPQRLDDPENRTLDFTQKCKIGAEREKIALVRTVDLFRITQYLNENKNEKYKKACRDAIYNGLGTVVKFPDVPKRRIKKISLP